MSLHECRTCGVNKPLLEFPVARSCKLGFDISRCSACKSKATRESYAASSRESKVLNRARSRAKLKGLPYKIKLVDIVIPDKCPVFNTPFVDDWTIDRHLPTLGYVPGNVNIISSRANIVKGDATLCELKAVVAWMESLQQ